MEKSNLYSKTFKKVLEEDSLAGDGGAFGNVQPTAGTFSGDTYAPGDSRNVFGGLPKKIQKRAGITSKSKKKRKKRKKSRSTR